MQTTKIILILATSGLQWFLDLEKFEKIISYYLQMISKYLHTFMVICQNVHQYVYWFKRTLCLQIGAIFVPNMEDKYRYTKTPNHVVSLMRFAITFQKYKSVSHQVVHKRSWQDTIKDNL